MKASRTATAVFAMGCFWQPDELFRALPGVLATEVGYTGGKTEQPSYEQVCSHRTGHAEAVKVIFDPDRVSYRELLRLFWMNHDPTTLDRQGPDVGDQYRSAVFYTDETQEREARAGLAEVVREKLWGDDPVVTVLAPAGAWWKAEDYHQKYLFRRGITQCHLPTPPKGRS